jgi:hypothetical protein
VSSKDAVDAADAAGVRVGVAPPLGEAEAVAPPGRAGVVTSLDGASDVCFLDRFVLPETSLLFFLFFVRERSKDSSTTVLAEASSLSAFKI